MLANRLNSNCFATMKKGGSLDYIADTTATSYGHATETLTKSASFHSFNQINVGSPPRSPSLSPLFNRCTPEQPAPGRNTWRSQENHKAMIQVGSPVQSPLLTSVMGGEQVTPEWSQRRFAPIPLPKPTAQRSPKPTPRQKQHIYEEPKNILPPNFIHGAQQAKRKLAASEPLSIKQLVENHRQNFPLMVRVYGGFLGSSERESFSEGDTLNIHFVKQAKVVLLRCAGRKVKVPMNSALQFGILYDPENNIKGAMSGYDFQTANQLMAQNPLPKLVCTCEAFVGPTSEESVEDGEILLLREVKFGTSTTNKFLLCTSLMTGKQKKLPENCVASFSTIPDKVKLFLPKIIKHFPLPVNAMVFLPKNAVEEPPFEDLSVITILSCQKETTVIATPCLDRAEVDEDLNGPLESYLDHHEIPVFDIPVELPMLKVQTLHKRAEDCEKLHKDTRRLFENYTSTKPSQHVPISTAQDKSVHYLTTREDKKDSGFQLIEPEAAYMTSKSIKGLQRTEDKAASPASQESQMTVPSASEGTKDEPIYDVPPDDISPQPEPDNIYQTPRNIPAFPQMGNAQTAPQNNIYQTPRSVLQLAEDQGLGPRGAEQRRQPSKGGTRYVAVTIGAPGGSKPTSPPPVVSPTLLSPPLSSPPPPSTPPQSPTPRKRTNISGEYSLPLQQQLTRPHPEPHPKPHPKPQWEHKYDSLQGEMESLKMDLKKALKSNQELSDTVKGEF